MCPDISELRASKNTSETWSQSEGKLQVITSMLWHTKQNHKIKFALDIHKNMDTCGLYLRIIY